MTTLANLRVVLETAVAEMQLDELPDLIGTLAAASARAQARLMAPVTETAIDSAKLVTAEQVAEIFNVPATQIGEMARQGRLPCIRIGKYVRFDLAAVRQALAEGLSSKTPSLRAPKTPSNGAAYQVPATTLLPRQRAKKAGATRAD